MDVLKHFLDFVCEKYGHTYDKLDNMAEIYRKGDIVPMSIVELDKDTNLFSIRFRIGLEHSEVAVLVSMMLLYSRMLKFDEDFLIHEEYGYLYGNDARKAFIERFQIKNLNTQKDTTIDDAIFICEEPIFAFGYNGMSRTRIRKTWIKE